MSPRIQALTEATTPSESRVVLTAVEKALGMAPNLHRTLAHSPAALKAYVAFAQALVSGVLPPTLRERIAITTAAINGCGYCAAAHTLLGKNAGLSPSELERSLRGDSEDPKAREALLFAQRVLAQGGSITDAELQSLRNEGFEDAAIVEIIAHIGMNWFTNIFNLVAKTEIDFPAVSLEGVSGQRPRAS